MRAISLWQPYASLIAIGAKRIETRSWPPKGLRVGEQIAIHATKTFPQDARDTFWSSTFRDALAQADIRHPRDLPRGAIVAIARLEKVVSTNVLQVQYHTQHAQASDLRMRVGLPQRMPIALSEREHAFGNYAPNRYAWVLTDVQPLLRPIAANGAQGIWNWQAPADLDEYLQPPAAVALWGGAAR